MQITRSPQEIQELWQVARRATDKSGAEYAEGVYDTLQWMTGNGEIPDLEES